MTEQWAACDCLVIEVSTLGRVRVDNEIVMPRPESVAAGVPIVSVAGRDYLVYDLVAGEFGDEAAEIAVLAVIGIEALLEALVNLDRTREWLRAALVDLRRLPDQGPELQQRNEQPPTCRSVAVSEAQRLGDTLRAWSEVADGWQRAVLDVPPEVALKRLLRLRALYGPKIELAAGFSRAACEDLLRLVS